MLKEDYPDKWDFEYFNKLPSSNERLKYSRNHLDKIGCGTGRCAYTVDGDKVLKVAHKKKGGTDEFNKGTEQNKLEAKISNDGQFGDIITKVYANSPTFHWIEVEKANKLNNESEFERIKGFPFSAFKDYLFTMLRNVYDKDKLGGDFEINPDKS